MSRTVSFGHLSYARRRLSLSRDWLYTGIGMTPPGSPSPSASENVLTFAGNMPRRKLCALVRVRSRPLLIALTCEVCDKALSIPQMNVYWHSRKYRYNVQKYEYLFKGVYSAHGLEAKTLRAGGLQIPFTYTCSNL
eukprot:560357-Prorocentrum_minimum.AAC.4